MHILLLPLLVLLMAMFGLGSGLIFTSMTTKYRDLTFFLQFGVQLLMYATPVIYPLSTIDEGKLKMLILANPITPLMETFKFAFLGAGHFSWMSLGYSVVFATLLLAGGIVVFHKTERNFIDTV